MNKTISRRDLLKGAGIGALAGLGLGSSQVFAQTTPSQADVIALNRFSLGDFQLTVIQDAAFALESAAFGIGAPEGAVDDVLAANNMPTGTVSTAVNVMLIETGSERILLDTGTGQRVASSLANVGLSPEDIDRVIISHFHGDHVGGLARDGSAVFSNASVHISQAEWDFIQGAIGNQGAQGAAAALQPAADSGMLEFFGDEDELVSGIQAVAAPGHTPGHHVFVLNSNGQQLMCTMDTANNFLVALAHPEWGFGFDGDKAEATDTRRAVFGRAADESMQVFAYHFPFPGVGYIGREGDGFRYYPNV